VKAGLELVAAVGSLKANTPLQTRVGIATGLVVVGDIIGSGAAQEQAIVGETPNLAARLQGIAAPDMVVIAESTRRLLGRLFELEDLGPKDLKGVAQRIRAFAVLRPSSIESRFEALRTATTPLVGREEEVDLLLRRWEQAKRGDGFEIAAVPFLGYPVRPDFTSDAGSLPRAVKGIRSLEKTLSECLAACSAPRRRHHVVAGDVRHFTTCAADRKRSLLRSVAPHRVGSALHRSAAPSRCLHHVVTEHLPELRLGVFDANPVVWQEAVCLV
jgi:Adenylate and Guanylate cyclase catalytic domain